MQAGPDTEESREVGPSLEFIEWGGTDADTSPKSQNGEENNKLSGRARAVL